MELQELTTNPPRSALPKPATNQQATVPATTSRSYEQKQHLVEAIPEAAQCLTPTSDKST